MFNNLRILIFGKWLGILNPARQFMFTGGLGNEAKKIETCTR